MGTGEREGPIYDDKVRRILERLEAGKTREEVAEEEGYSSWKSLDIYMRRRGFRREDGSYVPDVPEEEGSLVPEDAGPKEALVISMLGAGNGPREVAERAGFEDHRQMAEHMRSSGYVWDSEKENYVPEEDREAQLPPPREAAVEELLEENVDEDLELEVPLPTTGGDNGSFSVVLAEMAQYLPLLRELQQKKDVLDRLLDGSQNRGQVPKYAVPGESTTKFIYMAKRLSHLVEEFSSRKNMSQREIVEAALVEYLMRYGFSVEVKSLLGEG